MENNKSNRKDKLKEHENAKKSRLFKRKVILDKNNLVDEIYIDRNYDVIQKIDKESFKDLDEVTFKDIFNLKSTDVKETLKSGARQNKVEENYHCLFPSSLKKVAITRGEGIVKYGEFNHLRIDPKENIGRAIRHLYEYLDEETREDEEHLSHAIVRIFMAFDFINKFGYTNYDSVKEKVEEFISNNK